MTRTRKQPCRACGTPTHTEICDACAQRDMHCCDRCGIIERVSVVGPEDDYRELCALCILADDIGDLRAELHASGVELTPHLTECIQSMGRSYSRALASGERTAAWVYGLALQGLLYSALYSA